MQELMHTFSKKHLKEVKTIILSPNFPLFKISSVSLSELFPEILLLLVRLPDERTVQMTPSKNLHRLLDAVQQAKNVFMTFQSNPLFKNSYMFATGI